MERYAKEWGYYIFVVFPMKVTSLEFDFTDFAFVTLLQCTAKMFLCYLISRKQLVREINPTQNLRLLRDYLCSSKLKTLNANFMLGYHANLN